jgi:FixJ family two-component response regulator
MASRHRIEFQVTDSDDNESPIVVVIDDDRDVRDALDDLVQSVGLRAESFASAQEYLDRMRKVAHGCLILDVRLPGRNGLDFHDDLVKAGVRLPVVFISGHADVPMSVRAMKAGAIEFLTKPVRHQDLLDAIQRAIEEDRDRRNDEHLLAELRAAFGTLTAREREVMTMVVAGHPNKQIAAAIAVSEATVKMHRGQVMRKMRAHSLPELVRMADRLSHTPTKV